MRYFTVLLLAYQGVSILTAPIAMAAKVELPPPTGPHGVGRSVMYIKDDDRAEEWTEDPNDRRALPLIIWYPAEVTASSKLADYAAYPAENMRGPLVFESARGRALITHTYAEVPLAKTPAAFPVVLFSAGAGASPTSYLALIEDLVSHGFIVVGMDHTYDGAGQIMQDGRMVEPTVEKFRPQGVPSSREFQKASLDFYIRRVSVRAADAGLAVRTLGMMNRNELGFFHGRLDLDRIGVFGHSLGGVAASHALSEVDAIESGINLDGHVNSMPFDENHTPAKPFMCIEAPGAPPTDEDLTRMRVTRAQYEANTRADDERQAEAYRTDAAGAFRVTISGAEHGNFSDEEFPKPEKASDGPTRAQYMAAARTYVLAFFQQTLLGEQSTALHAVPAEFVSFVKVEAFGRAR